MTRKDFVRLPFNSKRNSIIFYIFYTVSFVVAVVSGVLVVLLELAFWPLTVWIVSLGFALFFCLWNDAAYTYKDKKRDV